MAFSPQFLDELRARIGLADVISKRVKLNRKGREYTGLCPFHKEKTPSFTVNEEKGFYHCFGCQAHGSAIDFVMNSEGLSFPEAVRRLAEDAGIEVPQDSPEERERDQHRQTLYDVMEKACALFEEKLKSPDGERARNYLKNRGVNERSINRFRLGYAPDSRGELKDRLGCDGISEELLLAAGLVIKPDDRGRDAYDRFRGRLMFPITDRRGRVIAFGGRILAKGEPKYLNSPETALFHKGRVLYGLATAMSAARKTSRLVVTEGYMDVIALYQAGLESTVAPLGTALSEDQIMELWRLVNEPVLCFDGDAAGQRAAARAAEHALPILKPGYGLRFAVLDGGDDPDSLIRRAGIGAMNDVLDAAAPLSDVLWRIETGGRVPRTPEERASLQKRMEKHAGSIGDSTVRAHFSRDFNERIWARQKSLNKKSGWAPSMQIEPNVQISAHVDPVLVAQQTLVSIILNHPHFFQNVEDQFGGIEFSNRSLDHLRQEIISVLSASPDLEADALGKELLGRGLEGELGELRRNIMLRRHKMIGREASGEDIMATWDENLRYLQNMDFEMEMEKKIQAEDLSDEGLRRQLDIKRAELDEDLDNGHVS